MASSIYDSPLRYPGGKSSMVKFLAYALNINGPINTYIEPFAGGAGAALGLLFKNHVNEIILNDSDEFIYKFWDSVLYKTTKLIRKIENTPVTIEQWKMQREILLDEGKKKRVSDLEIGFTAFYLNRCNRSGILKSGPIGGQEQTGEWKINARFNKPELIQRIKRIASFKHRISLYNDDALVFLKDRLPSLKCDIDTSMVYLDPPYFKQGPELYRYFYIEKDHQLLKELLEKELNIKWILSYDDVEQINELYKGVKKNGVQVNHFANKAKVGKELIILSDRCHLPHVE